MHEGPNELDGATEAGGRPALNLESAAITDPAFCSRYQVHSLLGVGGMGEVALCTDRRLRRDVALKLLRESAGADADLRARFRREALLQARLDHPAIVPVHELDSAGDRMYFTMKRVRGRTLREVLDAIADGDEKTSTTWSRGRLMAAFAQVCLAVDYAHSRNVIHRDLKPQNVMLGEFGEVHVLDWGIAKHTQLTSTETEAVVATTEDDSLGTMGYMAPEQIVGDDVTPATDVFALGAILFEIMGGGPLVPAGSRSERAQATMRGVEMRVRERANELGIPPELEATILRATMPDARARFATARELANAVQRYVDGDRDGARRRELADASVEKAKKALSIQDARARSLARPVAVRELSRALALDPAHEEASGLLGRLLLEPPAETPAEVTEMLKSSRADSEREAARTGLLRYVLWLVFIPWYLVMGVNEPIVLALITLCGVISAVAMGLTWKNVLPPWAGLVSFGASTIFLTLASRGFSPLCVVPSLAATNVMFFAGYVRPHVRRVIVALTVLSVLLPFGLEAAGLVSPTFEITSDGIRILPRMLGFDAQGTLGFFLSMAVLATGVPAIAAGRVRDELARAEERLAMTAWQLGELVPKPAPRPR